MVMIAGMFSSYGYLAEYLGKVTKMGGGAISIMLLLFGGAGIAGNWLTGIALSKNVLVTTRIFMLSLILIHLLAYSFGGLFVPMAVIISVWGFIHTGGFLIGQTRSTSEAPEAPELAASLMVSFGNAGVTLGTLLGGIVITQFSVHEIVWMSMLLLLVAFGLSFVKVGKKEIVNESEAEVSVASQALEPALEL